MTNDFDVERLLPPGTFAKLGRLGLHRVLGAMNGVTEMTIKEAAAVIGMKAYVRRKEAAQVALGIAAFAELRGEKVAQWGELLRRSVMPAVAGAGLAMVPDLLSEGPMDQDKALQHALIGGALGGVGGAGRTIQRMVRSDPAFAQQAMQVLQGLPK